MKKILTITVLSLLMIMVMSMNENVHAEMVPFPSNPYQYYEDLKFSEISLGGSHSAAITTDGRLYTWGFNNFGQLGNTTNNIGYDPEDITNNFVLNPNEIIVKVALGRSHSLAITSEGRVFTWGWNIYGQLGNGGTANKDVPTEITSKFSLNPGETVIDASLGYVHSIILTSEGRVFTFGSNSYGQLGNDLSSNQDEPFNITGSFALESNETIVKISAGDYHSLALTSNNRIYVWGYNNFGQVGDDSLVNKDIPVDITSSFALSGAEVITVVEGGTYHSGAVTSTGRTFTWGKNNSAQLGNGTTDFKQVPTEITSGFTLNVGEIVTDISLGGSHSMAITSEDRLFSWGFNYYGQLGDNSTAFRYSPVGISSYYTLNDSEGISKFGVGGNHSSFITSNGRLFIWGNNGSGQVGDKSATSYLVPLEIFGEKVEVLPLPSYSSVSEINKILLTYLNPETNGMNNFIELSIFPEFDFGVNVKNIKVNGVTYNNTSFVVDNGLIILKVPNTWNIGDTVTLTVEQITFIDYTDMIPAGDLIASTVLVEDLTPPIISYENEVYAEVGLGDITLISPTALDDTGDILSITVSGTVDWNTVGEYQLNYTTTDLSGNVATLNQTFYVFDNITTDNETVYSFELHHLQDEDYSPSTSITNQVVRYNTLDYPAQEDYSTYTYHLNDNVLVYHFTIDNQVIIVSKTVDYGDDVPPTFDVIANQTIAEDEFTNIDWTTYILNQQDNSDGTLTTEEVEDNVIYDTPGVYSVTVKLVDESLNETMQSFTVTVNDATNPSVSLNANLDSIVEDASWTDSGVTVTDFSSTTTVVTGAVDSSTAGVYPITYTVTDAAGNVTVKVRYVTVYEKANTVVFTLGKAKTTITLNEGYLDGSCKIVYNGIQKECTVKSNNVDNTTPGIYTVVYSYSRDDNEYTFTRYVFVTDGINELTLYYRKEEEGEQL